jgi:putative aldouronate transport system substrate-binding protein
MNKTMKIAAIAVSAIMAGTMALSIAGCSDKKSSTLDVKVDDNGNLTWASTTTLNLNVGNQNSSNPMGISYRSTEISGSTVLPDGNTYTSGDLKPAWAELSKQLKLNLADKFQNLGSDKQITTPITSKNISDYDVITGSLSAINENSDQFLNLADYLDYMPNYKAFLEANPVTKYSLTGTAKGAMYAAPYFDGNDDIEKYSMVNYLWVYDILDNDMTGKYATTFKAQAEAKATAVGAVGTQASAESFMGKTGSYTIETTDPSDATKTVTVKVDYDAALAAAKDANTGLGGAIAAAAGKTYAGTSGNIVDLQNFAINEKAGEVTGIQLATILREYIKVAYTSNGSQFYSSTKLSDVFCSQSAAWDVDLLVGISRCVVTCGVDLTSSVDSAANIYALSGRQTTTQRRVDLMALAGELYGVRGMESRYEYTYFDKDGNLLDARSDENSYEMMNNLSKLTKEGLVNIGTTTSKTTTDANGKETTTVSATSVSTKASGTQVFMLHDYAQTQTKDGLTSITDTSKYNFAPIVNAISNWDTNNDGTADTIMRFTESWRSVKNTGFAVPLASVQNDSEKLAAVLGFIDYLFSNDGQILMTYGPQSTNGDTNPNGWWYATEATSASLATVATKVTDATLYAPAQYEVKSEYKSQYFVYNGKVYTGTSYNGTQVPTITTLNQQFYLGKEVTIGTTTIKQNDGNVKVNAAGNYTNYARNVIGSTLPIGNKNQGYEYQATAKCAITGAAIVSTALLNGTLKHVKLTLDSNDTYWYMIAPTALPLNGNQRTTLKGDAQTLISGTYFLNSSSTDQITNVYIDLLYYGFNSSNNLCGQSSLGTYTTYNSGKALVELLASKGLTDRISISQTAWKSLKTLYKI